MKPQLPALMTATLLLYGCQDTTSSPEVWDQTGLPPDFQLEDVNSTSTSFGGEVSPRDRLESVSGWYFAHAT